MPRAVKAKSPSKESTANLGFEARLWLSADNQRNNMDAAEYKPVVLGVIFLKYISDAVRNVLRADLACLALPG